MKIKKVHVYPNVTWTTLTKNLRYDIAILELVVEVSCGFILGQVCPIMILVAAKN